MKNASKIAISLPSELLDRIDNQCQQTGQKRSVFIREAVVCFFKQQKKQQEIQQYINGYQNSPETIPESVLPVYAISEVIAEDKWE